MKDAEILEKIEAALRAGDSLALDGILTDVALSFLSYPDFANQILPVLLEVAHDRRMMELGGSVNVLLLLQQELNDASISPRIKESILPRLIGIFKEIGETDSAGQLVITEILGSCYGNKEALEGLADLLFSSPEGQEGHILSGFSRLCKSAKSIALIRSGLKDLEEYISRCPKRSERALKITISEFKDRLR